MYPMSDTTNVCHHRFLSLNYRDYVQYYLVLAFILQMSFFVTDVVHWIKNSSGAEWNWHDLFFFTIILGGSDMFQMRHCRKEEEAFSI